MGFLTSPETLQAALDTCMWDNLMTVGKIFSISYSVEIKLMLPVECYKLLQFLLFLSLHAEGLMQKTNLITKA